MHRCSTCAICASTLFNGSAVTHAVRGVSFQLGHEKLAIVGESGSGKSTVGRALLQLHPKKARVSASRMQFADLDLQHLSESADARRTRQTYLDDYAGSEIFAESGGLRG